MIHLQLKVINDRKIENAFTQFYETKGKSKWLMHFNPSLGIRNHLNILKEEK